MYRSSGQPSAPSRAIGVMPFARSAVHIGAKSSSVAGTGTPACASRSLLYQKNSSWNSNGTM